MADISLLGNLATSEPLNFDQYADAKEGFELPKAGVYTLRAPEQFPPTAFGATKAGFLSAQIDPTIVGPTHEGFNIRFTKVSAKPFERRGMRVSQLGDYLRATGRTGTIPGDPQQQANAVEQTAGLVYQAHLDWRAYSKTTGYSIEGMSKFPKNGSDTTHQPWIELDGKDGRPMEKDEQGNPVRLRANLVLTRYIPAA